MKKASIITVIIGGVLMLVGALPFIFTTLLPKPTQSIGIIGGADGPTAIFVTSTLWLNSIYGKLVILGVVSLIVGVVLLFISKFKKK